MSDPFYLAALFGAHATCSVSMVLLNKTLAQGFDFPWTVLFLQNVGTILIGYLPCCGDKRGRSASVSDGNGSKHLRIFGMKVPRATKNKLWVLLQVAFFIATLFTSLKALRFISVPLYVVARNTVPAQTAVLERFFTGVRLSYFAVAGLACTVVGAVVYTYGDLQGGLDFGGLTYAVMLTVIVAGTSVIDKTAVRILGQEEDIKPVECNQIRVAVALPINALLMLAFEFGVANDDERLSKPDIYTATEEMTSAVAVCLLLSTIFGFGMGTFNFYLQQAVSAATVQVANILYKLFTTILSRVTHPAPVAVTSWVGFAISLVGIALYTYGPKAMAAPAPPRFLDPKGESP